MSEVKTSYPLAAAAAKVENFEAVNEGIWVTPEALQNIETSLTENASTITAAGENVERLTAENTQLTANLATANQTITDRDATIATLNEKIVSLNKEPAKVPAATVVTADNLHDANGAAPVHPVTAEAEALLKLKNGQ